MVGTRRTFDASTFPTYPVVYSPVYGGCDPDDDDWERDMRDACPAVREHLDADEDIYLGPYDALLGRPTDAKGVEFAAYVAAHPCPCDTFRVKHVPEPLDYRVVSYDGNERVEVRVPWESVARGLAEFARGARDRDSLTPLQRFFLDCPEGKVLVDGRDVAPNCEDVYCG